MVDTDSQLNAIDSALRDQLNLKSQGTVGLIAAVTCSHTSGGVLNSLQAASQVVFKPLVIVQGLGAIQATDRRIHGVPRENFLAHLVCSIDYSRGLLCLDQAADAVLNAMSHLGGHNFGHSE